MFSEKNHSYDEQKLVDKLFDSKSTYWTEIYNEKDVYSLIHQQRLAIALKFVDELSLPKASPILEIGCGAGFMVVALAKRGFSVEATDNVPAMVKQTEKNAKQNGVENRVHATTANIHKLPYQDESFRLVVALGVIPWIPDLMKALSEVSRVLMSGGFAILNFINRYRLNQILDPLSSPAFQSSRRLLKRELVRIGLNNLPNRPSLHFYSIREFNMHLKEVNLTSIKDVNFGFGPFLFLKHNIFPDGIGVKIHQKLQLYSDGGFPILRSTGAQYVVLARKG